MSSVTVSTGGKRKRSADECWRKQEETLDYVIAEALNEYGHPTDTAAAAAAAATRGFIFGLAVTFLIETLNNEYEFINRLSQSRAAPHLIIQTVIK